MQIELTDLEYRRLLDLVYIGNWVLNSTRGDDRFQDYDDLESKIFALSPALSELWNGVVVPSKAFAEGGIHEAIMALTDQGAFAAQMTGSGSAVFGVFTDEASAAQAYETLCPRWERTYLCSTCTESVVFTDEN